jgi:putative oxidoreductase
MLRQTILKIKQGFMGQIILGAANFLEQYFSPIILLIIRLWMAHIFWFSGLIKISDWSTTLSLFQNIYNVPVISPTLAAYLATTTELTTPILLLFGFATRLATIPMLVMTAVIQFTYFQSMEHYYWAMLLGTLLCFGPGKLSIDYWLRKLGS